MYGCNPKYLSEYIINNRNDWKVVWAFLSPANHDVKGIIKVRYLSLKYFYHLYTSKVFVTNYRMPSSFKKRKGQFYVQTWHSSLRLKMIEGDARQTLTEEYIKMAKTDSRQTDMLLSGCQFSTNIFKRAFWFDGPIVETGTPRADILFSQDDKVSQRVREKLGVSNEVNLVLYAPTFRKDHTLKYYDIDFSRILLSLSHRFGGDWAVLLRLHPHLRELSTEMMKTLTKGKVIDATSFDDIQELLHVSDVVISDYSSLIFDFTLTNRPCFLYVPDLQEYIKNDRQLYFDINELPFPKSVDNDSLNNCILEFDDSGYAECIQRFNNTIGSFETGHACENVMVEIENRIRTLIQ